MFKKAEMGVGTLIVFIAMLLVAAVAAGVLISTASSLQEKSLSTGQQAKSQISTNAETIEVSATDGRDTLVNYFNQIMKLAPGSDPIKLSQVIFTFSTKDATATLKYRGVNGVPERNASVGYYTRKLDLVDSHFNSTRVYNLSEDIDNDGNFSDSITVDSTETLIQINYSSNPTIMRNVSIGFDLGTCSPTSDCVIDIERQFVDGGNISLGEIKCNGTMNTNHTIEANVCTLYPYREGEGYFVAEYLQEGTNHVDGNLQRGDVIKVYYEAPEDISEDMLIRLNFIPKVGTSTLTEFVTPDVMSTERVYLYP
jgi:flagellin-like protein